MGHDYVAGFGFGNENFGVPADDIILAEFGTVVTYQANKLPGFRVQRIDLDAGNATDFLVNKSGLKAIPDTGVLWRLTPSS